jgi:hypothetical protein
MCSFVSKSLSRVLALALVAFMPVALAAQNSAKPADNSAPEDGVTKWDIFVGYSYIAPQGTVITPAGGQNIAVPYSAILGGGIGSVARYFNKYYGVEGVGDIHLQNEDQKPWATSRNDMSGGSIGLIARYPNSDVTPFVHALVGAELVGGPYYQADTMGAVVTAGAGADYHTPLFHSRLSIRLFQVDYQYTHENFGTGYFGGRANINAIRASAGIVFGLGGFAPPVPITLACSASPASIFPGDPVTVTATAGDVNPKLTAVYTWTGTGVTGSGTTATVATGGLAAGTYTVKGEVKEGPKPGQTADCSASFTVKAYEPPTISCSASPSTINPGDSSTITSVGVSPQNRPLTYSYSASAGSVSGSGTTAAFSSAGAPTGAVGITCNVSDDKGQTATGSTSVTITAPYVKPIPHASALCSITFDKDEKRPTRVDNEAKACLDQVTQALKSDSTATVVVVGESTAKEKEMKEGKGKKAKPVWIAAQRAVNTKAYLVTEEQSGIDASRVSARTGTTDGKTVEDYLVPSGATFDTDVQGTTAVDETAVKPEARKPMGAAKPMHHKKAGKPAPGK